MWPFGKKVACFQCDAKVKEKASRLRRGFRFCSEACVRAFLDGNQLRRPPGDDAQLRQELGNLAISALGELTRLGARGGSGLSIRGSSGTVFTLQASAVGVAMEQQRDEEVTDALYRFNQHVTEALPYLVALGMTAELDALDTIDLDAAISQARGTPAGARAAAEGLQRHVVAVLERL